MMSQASMVGRLTKRDIPYSNKRAMALSTFVPQVINHLIVTYIARKES